ncbi:unnamed protein product [Lactuca saligna]|uniref:Uncharacterized protein n=1 Tax=Lactuca saligna TaxID=75948 RepID=A0AA35ZLK3_LACSI|nr:unnamed protein product [Lactuca saligna]
MVKFHLVSWRGNRCCSHGGVAHFFDQNNRSEPQMLMLPLIFFTPIRIIREAIASLGSPAPILVSEGANTMDVGQFVLVQMEPKTYLDAGTWGAMGVGLIASPDQLVVEKLTVESNGA